ncbi:SseB family protein [Microbacterium tumbae]
MRENTPAAVRELDLRKEAFESAPGDAQAEMAVWEAASQLAVWFLVDRGTLDRPLPSGFEVDGVGRLLGVYSTGERAAAVAGERGTVLAVPLPQALDWLASFAEQDVAGLVLDSPGPWTSLSNLRYFKNWIPRARTGEKAAPSVIAPQVQAATDAYAADRDDRSYAATVRAIADSELFVVLDPQGDGAAPTSIVNGRGERVLLAFTDSDRVDAIYGDKGVQVETRRGADILRLIGDEFDVLVLDPQHPSSFAATPEWIGDDIREGGARRRGRSR